MTTKAKKRKSAGASKRFIGKPGGLVQERVKAVGPEHFGVVAVDCAKRQSKWMLCDFYGKVLLEPRSVEHNSGALQAMCQLVTDTCHSAQLSDCVIAVEMTGIYHKPVFRCFRKAGFDTRVVHSYASSHYRRTLHPGDKTDDHDLEAIFHAAINGYGLAVLPVSEEYLALQALSRHRCNLVKQRSRTMVQIRRLLHMTMPGFADLFDEDALFHQSIAMPVALRFTSAESVRGAGVKGISNYLKSIKVRFHAQTVERIVAWSNSASAPAELAPMLTRQWQQLNDVRCLLSKQIDASEVEMASFLVKTPYILLLTVRGINVVSAARLAGEAGPIDHYANGKAINGRAGLYPARYQSDQVDRNQGLVKHCNRRLRAAAMLIAENLIKCNPYYRGLSEFWKKQQIDTSDRHCRIANRAMRMVYQLVGGKQVWKGRGVDREYVLLKIREFHQAHQTPPDQTIRDMYAALNWLPKTIYSDEAQPLIEIASKKRRGATSIGDLLLVLLIRLGVCIEDYPELESSMSEARS